ncbi:MAG: SpoIIIAH-like family protein, partial [Clostridia bacterium]|nr:SpoIIIAH-like family protein [Clostridia bacterium]
MKKGKVFTKSQAILVIMVLCLGAAVWLNMKFSSSEKYLGAASYVNGTTSGKAVQTSAKVDKTDENYFEVTKKERADNLKKQQDTVKETLRSTTLTDDEKQAAVDRVSELVSRMEAENNIETLLKAKDFADALVVIGEKDVNVIVKSEGLTTTQTLQIQDIITAQTNIPLANIKIV